MPLFNPSGYSLSPTSQATPTVVAASTASVTLLAANPIRKGATIFNNGSANLFLDFGAAASLTAFLVKVGAFAYYEVPYSYTGMISGIWDAISGSAEVRELLT